jgi:hypothetical protein
VEDDHQIRVTYVGLTGHLWMVTMGRLPGSGGAAAASATDGRGTQAKPASASTSSSPSNSAQDAYYGTGFARFPQRRSAPRKNGSSPAGTCARRWNLRQAGWDLGLP